VPPDAVVASVGDIGAAVVAESEALRRAERRSVCRATVTNEAADARAGDGRDRPARVQIRTQLLPVSAMYRLPAISTATPRGYSGRRRWQARRRR
jgi:hypothetical protein